MADTASPAAWLTLHRAVSSSWLAVVAEQLAFQDVTDALSARPGLRGACRNFTVADEFRTKTAVALADGASRREPGFDVHQWYPLAGKATLADLRNHRYLEAGARTPAKIMADVHRTAGIRGSSTFTP